MSELVRAVRAIEQAEAFIFTAGAGMGVDSGLPDFRGDNGFWKAYPAYGKAGQKFSDLAQPGLFKKNPALGWGFYGHRLNLYRNTIPHEGYNILRSWSKFKPTFVCTSNVDEQFQRAGFEPTSILEVHGSIFNAQCTAECGAPITRLDDFQFEISDTFEACGKLPMCSQCGSLLRPNILMFQDYSWNAILVERQEMAFKKALKEFEGLRIAVIECGAGLAIPTIRNLGEDLCDLDSRMLIRINVREFETRKEHIGLAMGAKDALQKIAAGLKLNSSMI